MQMECMNSWSVVERKGLSSSKNDVVILSAPLQSTAVPCGIQHMYHLKLCLCMQSGRRDGWSKVK